MDKLWTDQTVAFPAISKQHSAGDREKAGVKDMEKMPQWPQGCS